MKNTTVVIATTFALVASGLTVEMARRHTSAEAGSAASIADAAPAPIAKTDGATKAEAPAAAQQASVLEDIGSEKPLAAPTPTQPTLTEPTVKAQGESPPMRDASPPAPHAALLNAGAGRDAQSVVEPNDEKTSGRQSALFATPQGPAPDAEAKDGQQPKPAGAKIELKSADKTALVKPAIPKRGKSETEKATTDKPADAPKPVRPCETHHRLAKTHRFERDAEQRRSERYAAARTAPAVKWQGGNGAEPHPAGDVYAFSGAFGECRYRGFVSLSGYRIISSC